MKLLDFYSVIVCFVSLVWVADVRGTTFADSEIKIENCEQICKDIEDTSQDTGSVEACLGQTFLVNSNEEGYIDDIPFDTEKVIEEVDRQEIIAEEAKDENLTILQLFIKWVALLFRLN